MKTKLFIVAALGLWLETNAQELSKVSVVKNQISTTNYHLNNQTKVQDTYNKLDKVYMLDFTHAKTKSLDVELIENTKKAVKKANFVDYSNVQAIGDLLAIQPEALTVVIPFKENNLTIDLVKVDLFGDGFQVNSDQPEMVQGVKTGVYYQGTVRGENSLAAFSFFENEFTALISNDWDTDRTIEIGRIEDNSKNIDRTHIIYSDDDLLVNVSHPCESESLDQYHEAVEGLAHENFSHNSAEKALYKCVTYFWETSYNLYTSKGSTQAVSNYMTSLFNNFQLIYNNESIGSKLNQLYIWTTQDSYNNTLATYAANRSNFGANLATLFSTNGGGGLGYVDVICSSSDYYRKGFCGSVGNSFASVPNFSWPVNVACHEVGHNLGSPHTHACSWTGGAIDGCGPAAGYNEGCNAALPTNGGTMMSYCHLLNIGINFSLGFGPQPGNLIRSRVNSCITLQCNETGIPGSSCSSSYEPNESQTTAATVTSGSTISAAISSSTDIDYYKITTTSTSNITFALTGPTGVDYDLIIYNNSGTQIGSSTGSTASETVTLNNLVAGTYAIKIYGYNGANTTTCYTFKATAIAATNCASAYEPNESFTAASVITLSTPVTSAISTSSDNDYFKIVTTSLGTYAFNMTGPSGVDFDMAVYNSSYSQIGAGTGLSSTEAVSLSNLAAGTYYVRIYGYNGATSSSCYNLTVSKTGASVSGSSNDTLFILSPNPATDKLMIHSSEMETPIKVDVIDINGQLLSKHQIAGNSSIDVGNLVPGVYFVRIFTENSGFTQLKFVKQ